MGKNHSLFFLNQEIIKISMILFMIGYKINGEKFLVQLSVFCIVNGSMYPGISLGVGPQT